MYIYVWLIFLHIYAGDAFLLVWKPKGDVGISTVADASLRRYCVVLKYLNFGTKITVWKPKGDVVISSVADASLRRYSVVLKYVLKYLTSLNNN